MFAHLPPWQTNVEPSLRMIDCARNSAPS